MINEEIMNELMNESRQAITYAISVAKHLDQLEQGIREKIQSLYRDNEQLKTLLNPKASKGIPLKQLYQKGQLESVSIEKTELNKLKRELNKHGVKFSVTRNKKTNEYVVFFQAKDSKVMDHAFKKAILSKDKSISKPSTIALLKHFKSLAKALSNQKERTKDKSVHKDLER